MISARRARLVDSVLVAALFVAGTLVSLAAMRAFRAAHIQPWFYQGNFEPAVMMSCGRGFRTTTAQAIPVSLRAFLDLARNEFTCADLRPDLPLVPVTWNATWLYLYATTALVWKITGISWTALDGLVAVLSGVTTASLYGLFRLVSTRSVATGAALLLALSPANLVNLLSLRDYSKAAFVLPATFALGLLIVRPMTRAPTIALAGVFGAIVGIGYGFRSDLAVMAPFGVIVMMLFLPGTWRANIGRNLAAAATAAAVFLIVAFPALQGLKTGGCQFHYGLLGLTTPLAGEAGVTPSLYSFGDHFTDTLVDLKVGDYANRVLGRRAPILCSPEYDTASGELFRRYALTFPADLAVHAYGAALIITRSGIEIPDMAFPLPGFLDNRIGRAAYRWVNRVTGRAVLLGPLLTGLAIAVAWSDSPRLGLALTAFVLFLGGYPAIEFEARHWFHLRFIPWWCAALVGSFVFESGIRQLSREALLRAAIGVSATLVGLFLALAALRVLQTRRVVDLVRQYDGAKTAPLSVTRHESSTVVDWRPNDYGSLPEHRASDLLVVTLDPSRCGDDPLAVRVRYEADLASHDLSATIALDRPFAAAGPARLFVPVFANGSGDHSYLRFASFETAGRPAECLANVARVVDRDALPLWVQMQAPADWRDRRLYQTLRRPRFFRTWLSKDQDDIGRRANTPN